MIRSSFAWPDGRRAAVSLSFDDARPSQADTGIPILDRYGVKATFYLSPNRVPERLAAWRAAAAGGHEMGNHTMTHPCSGNFAWSRTNALEEYTLERLEHELLDANAYIKTTLGVQPTTYAYCCGQKYVGRGAQLQSSVPLIARYFIAGRGFRDETPNDPTFCDLAQVCGVDSDDASFEALRAWIDRARDEGGWLVFASHEVGNFARQAMRAEVLDAVCRYCNDPANGIWIDTVAAVARFVRDWQHAHGVQSGLHIATGGS